MISDRYLLVIIIILYSPAILGQSSIQGKVISKENGKPMQSVSVYLDNTSVGTITDEKGIFHIRNIPEGKFRLVASAIGYETYVQTIDPKQVYGEISVQLNPAPEELKGLDVLPPDPDGWIHWGKLFTELFIGSSEYAFHCQIKNPEIIKFRFNKKENILIAYATKPIEILNNSIGYNLKYKLEEFEYDISNKLLIYIGYAFFTDLALSDSKLSNRWKKTRADVYELSLLHFMRVFFVNELKKDGFVIRNLGMISNPKKDRAKMLFDQHPDSVLKMDATYLALPDGSFVPLTMAADSTEFYKKSLLEPDSIISQGLLPADSLGFAADSVTAGLYYKDSIEISNTLSRVPAEYRNLSRTHKYDSFPISRFVFIHEKPVYVLSNGSYFGLHDLKITGFWAWWETIATLLPYDYFPSKNKVRKE